LRHCATSRKVVGSVPYGVIVWAKVQVLVYIQLSIILSALLPKPTYSQSSRYRYTIREEIYNQYFLKAS